MRTTPNILLALEASEIHQAMIKGFAQEAMGRGWALDYTAAADPLTLQGQEVTPDIVVLGNGPSGEPWRHAEARTRFVGMDRDLTAVGMPAVVPDHLAVGQLAARALMDLGLRHFAAFEITRGWFSVERRRGFAEELARNGHSLQPNWHGEARGAGTPAYEATLARVQGWLRALPRPVGIFACCDGWAVRILADARRAGLQVPEEIAVLGAGNEEILCSMFRPPLSSVMVPWTQIGAETARLVARVLAGEQVRGLIQVRPTGVIERSSTDTLAVGDEEAARALAYIRQHAAGPLSVTDVARAVPTYRRRLERLFRRELGRTVVEEIRRVRVGMARGLLGGTTIELKEVALRCGFPTAGKMAVAFRKEGAEKPSVYRKRIQRGI